MTFVILQAAWFSEEIDGNLTQPGFWNFDALFTPQDHPAREMQDTFYIHGAKSSKFASRDQISKVAASHEKNWKYNWDKNESSRMVLRTHTTCVTIQHLAKTRPKRARVFSLGSVFRNEKSSYKHLAEFHQVEGVLSGPDATLRDLMGIQGEFYRRIGLGKVRFWPTFFPYTEPSLQTMVYNEKLGKWVEEVWTSWNIPTRGKNHTIACTILHQCPVLSSGGTVGAHLRRLYRLGESSHETTIKWLLEIKMPVLELAFASTANFCKSKKLRKDSTGSCISYLMIECCIYGTDCRSGWCICRSYWNREAQCRGCTLRCILYSLGDGICIT